MVNLVPPSEEDRLRDKKGKKALAQSTSVIMVVSFNSFLEFFLSVVCFFPHHFSFLLQSAMAAAWVYEDYERPFNLSDKWAAKINLL